MDALRTYLRSNRLKLHDLAQGVGRSLPTVRKWGTTREYPADALPAIEHFTQGAVSGRDLRPDLYPDQMPDCQQAAE